MPRSYRITEGSCNHFRLTAGGVAANMSRMVHIDRAHPRQMTPFRRASGLLLPAILGATAFTVIGVGAIGRGPDPDLVGTISANQATAAPGAADSASGATEAAVRPDSAAGTPRLRT